MKFLKLATMAATVVLLSGCGSFPAESPGVVMAPSSIECIVSVDGEYVDSCVTPLA